MSNPSFPFSLLCSRGEHDDCRFCLCDCHKGESMTKRIIVKPEPRAVRPLTDEERAKLPKATVSQLTDLTDKFGPKHEPKAAPQGKSRSTNGWTS